MLSYKRERNEEKTHNVLGKKNWDKMASKFLYAVFILFQLNAYSCLQWLEFEEEPGRLRRARPWNCCSQCPNGKNIYYRGRCVTEHFVQQQPHPTAIDLYIRDYTPIYLTRLEGSVCSRITKCIWMKVAATFVGRITMITIWRAPNLHAWRPDVPWTCCIANEMLRHNCYFGTSIKQAHWAVIPVLRQCHL